VLTLLLLCVCSTELGRLPRVKTCANLMRKICYNNKDRMMAGMICGGWDPYEGGQVYEIPLGGTLMKQKFALGGSGSSYIYGLVDSTYREGMSKEECKTFVKTGKMILLLHFRCCCVAWCCSLMKRRLVYYYFLLS
jgi:20S proteasome subunit beta 1